MWRMTGHHPAYRRIVTRLTLSNQYGTILGSAGFCSHLVIAWRPIVPTVEASRLGALVAPFFVSCICCCPLPRGI
jgi:hypothetical protein